MSTAASISIPLGSSVGIAVNSTTSTTISNSSTIISSTSSPGAMTMTSTTTTTTTTTATTTSTSMSAINSATTTYHVPRGAAAVANIAAPRPGTVSLGRTTQGATAITHASKWVHRAEAGSLVSGLRGLVPRNSGTAATGWLGSVSQAAGAAVRPRATTIAAVSSYGQSRMQTLSVSSRAVGPPVSRQQVQGEIVHTQVLHTTAHKQLTPQGVTTATVVTQAVSSQPRTPLSSTPTSVCVVTSASGQRVLVGSGVPATSTSVCSSISRPAAAAILTTAPRVSTIPGSVRPVATTNRVTVASCTSTATLALAVNTQVRPRLTASSTSRVSAVTPTPRLSASVRPAAVAAASSTGTVLPAQARLGVPGSTNVVSLHPVVVTSGAGLPLKSSNTRTTIGPKVLSQPMHAPASIQITQVPVSAVQGAGKLPPSMSPSTTQVSVARTVAYSASALLSNSGTNVRSGNTTTSAVVNPVTKVTLHTAPSSASQPISGQTNQTHQQQTQQQSQQSQPTSMCVQHRSSPAPAAASASPLAMDHTGSVLSTYNIPTYLYEASGSGAAGTYQVTSVVARPYSAAGNNNAASTASYAVQASATTMLRQGVMASSAPVKFNPVVVVDPSRSALPVHSSYLQEGGISVSSQDTAPPPPPPPAVSKPSASPRPSILRKRDNEGSPLKAQKNLTPVLASLSSGTGSNLTGSVTGAPVSPPSPRRPDSRGGGGGGGGNSSGGSTTISATSSPGLAETAEEATATVVTVKQEPSDEMPERPPPEMSPRKKPRKQQLTGNELHEPKFSEDEMEFISERIKKEVKEVQLQEEPVEKPPVLPPTHRPGLSLLSSYRHSWKSRHNHYMRYSDVRPKDERRPTVAELAAQKQVLQKLEGWKMYHLSTQMEELSELEQQVSERLADFLKLMEKRMGKEFEKDISRINELIKGNIQRSKVTCDQMQEAKVQAMKIFDHKNRVANIIRRCSNKRSLKKRDKS